MARFNDSDGGAVTKVVSKLSDLTFELQDPRIFPELTCPHESAQLFMAIEDVLMACTRLVKQIEDAQSFPQQPVDQSFTQPDQSTDREQFAVFTGKRTNFRSLRKSIKQRFHAASEIQDASPESSNDVLFADRPSSSSSPMPSILLAPIREESVSVTETVSVVTEREMDQVSVVAESVSVVPEREMGEMDKVFLVAEGEKLDMDEAEQNEERDSLLEEKWSEVPSDDEKSQVPSDEKSCQGPSNVEKSSQVPSDEKSSQVPSDEGRSCQGPSNEGHSEKRPNGFIFVKLPTTTTIRLHLDFEDTVFQMKCCIQVQEGLAVPRQRLFFEGTKLEDARTLSSYGIRGGDRLHLVLRLRPGRQTLERRYNTRALLPSLNNLVF